MNEEAPRPKVLCVDDEESILKSLKRCLRRAGVDVSLATSGEEALALLAANEFAVMICDQRMPGMSGSEVLEKSREVSPDTYRITLTGYTDLESAQKTINQGQVHQFLTKPWDDEHLRGVVTNGLRSYALIQENRRLEALTKKQNEELLEFNRQLELRVEERTKELTRSNEELKLLQDQQADTLRSTVRVLASTLEVVEPSLGIHSKRVAEVSVLLGKMLKLAPRDLQSLEFAANLHDFGRLAWVGKGAPTEAGAEARAAEAAAGLLSRIPGFASVRLGVRHQFERFDGAGLPEALAGQKIPLVARIVAVANAFDEAVYSGRAPSRAAGEKLLKAEAGKRFDPAVVEALLVLTRGAVKKKPTIDAEIEISPEQVEVGMVLSRDLLNGSGTLLLRKGTELNSALVTRVLGMSKDELLLSSLFVQASSRESTGRAKSEPEQTR